MLANWAKLLPVETSDGRYLLTLAMLDMTDTIGHVKWPTYEFPAADDTDDTHED